MEGRRSARLAEKNRKADANAVPAASNRRASIGAVMGLTPGKPRGVNLQDAKAADAAEAAARQLDLFNAGVRRSRGSHKKKRKSKKQRAKAKKSAELIDAFAKGATYQPRDRQSIALQRITDKAFDEDDSSEDESASDPGLPPGLVSPSDEEHKNEESGADNGGRGEGEGASVIATPGPEPKATKTDDEFIKDDEDSVSVYEPTDGETADDEDELNEDRHDRAA